MMFYRRDTFSIINWSGIADRFDCNRFLKITCVCSRSILDATVKAVPVVVVEVVVIAAVAEPLSGQANTVGL